MTQHNCENCSMRAKYDKQPKSLVSRFGRGHINFCPGGKGYMNSLDAEQKQILRNRYNLKK